jgi:glycosyltransferase involved in cell wall biosynthesis
MKIIRKGEKADICLLLEGTFPYVSGGVSSWVNQIIRGFPELTFAIVFLGSREEDYADARYTLPDNVVHLEAHYLHTPQSKPRINPRKGNAKAFADIRVLHDQYRLPGKTMGSELLSNVLEHQRSGRLNEEDFLYSRESWNYISEQYRTFCTDPSFVDYFWAVRIMHTPLWSLMKIAETLIPARAYHTISTGYAGFLGALLKQRTGRPLILSEHGIYTKERKIDLFQAQWIHDNRGILNKDDSEVAYFRDLWIRFFESLGHECYNSADQIIALYEVNRLRQISDGAPPERTMNIPNGINLEHLAPLRNKRADGVPLVVCLIGRVVPIKDIKTFISAIRTVNYTMPNIEAWIAGPEDEDPDYAEECRNLAESLNLEEQVKFLGFQKIDDILPKIGLLVLSSISEALPLVILEGYAAGVPCVSTDVGSCRQLIEGIGDDDRALGVSGEIVGIADPDALASAIVKLLGNQAHWQAAQTAGIKRVETYYTQELMFGKYRDVYESALQRSDLVDQTNKSKKSKRKCRWQV